ncbi:hypothetical protein ACFFRR_002001 [Megaselia abdita]
MILVFIIFFFLFYALSYQWRFIKLSFSMPQAGGIPFIGLALKIRKLKDILPTLDKCIENLGDVFFFWLGPLPVIFINDADVANSVFTSKNCLDKASFYRPVAKYLGDGLFSLGSKEWQKHRRLLNPSFNQKTLLSFLPIFEQGANCIIEDLEKLEGKDASDFSQIFHKTSLNVAAETTMGRKMSVEGETDLLPHYQNMLNLGIIVISQPWLSIDFFFKRWKHFEKGTISVNLVSNFSKMLIKQKVESEKEDSGLKSIFIDQAISLVREKKFTLQELEDEAANMIFGAFETTASILYSLLMCMAFNPECQEKLYNEIITLMPEEREVTLQDLGNLSYMEMVIFETLRLLPAVPLIGRKTDRDLHLSNNLFVPKSTEFIISIFHIHRNKKYWGENALVFNPDNFLPENTSCRSSYAFMPFTRGIRNCIGKQYAMYSLKVVLSKIIRKFKFSTTAKFEELEYVEAVILKFRKIPEIKVQFR